MALFQNDKDEEEIRHRATHYIRLLEEKQSSEKVESRSEDPRGEETVLEVEHLDELIGQLDEWMDEGVFEMEDLPLFAEDKSKKKKTKKTLTKTERIQQKHDKKQPSARNISGNAKTGDEKVGVFLQKNLGNEIGDCIFTSEFEKLSEEDFEYFVKARKHTFKQLLVVEFLIENNSENQMQKVQIKLGRF